MGFESVGRSLFRSGLSAQGTTKKIALKEMGATEVMKCSKQVSIVTGFAL